MNPALPPAVHPINFAAEASPPTSNAEFLARVERYPQLRAQFEAALDEMENRAGTCDTADQAEDAIVERMRQIGREVLTQWAEQRQATLQPARTPGLRQGGKKSPLANDARSDRGGRTTLATRRQVRTPVAHARAAAAP